MRRSIGLGMVTIVGVFATMTTYEARQARASLTVYEIADNLYMLANASSVQGMGGGGNTAIFVTDDGVALVDTKIKGYGQDILAEVRKITDKPVTTIINTHTHWDHTGSNTRTPAGIWRARIVMTALVSKVAPSRTATPSRARTRNTSPGRPILTR